jgi:hypothetical protein
MKILLRGTALVLLPVVAGTACIPVRPPAPAVDARGAPITTEQILAERRITHQTVDGILMGLAGGAAGLLLGAKVGYEIGYAHDIHAGCEDCGLGGLLLGATIGLASGAILGGNLGTHVGAGADRADAVQKIIIERARSAYFYREKNSHIVGAPLPAPGIVVTPSASSESRNRLGN